MLETLYIFFNYLLHVFPSYHQSSKDMDIYFGDCVKELISNKSPGFCFLSIQDIHQVDVCTSIQQVWIYKYLFCLTTSNWFQTLAELRYSLWTEIFYRLGVLNSAVNPLIYALWYKHFRSGVSTILSSLYAKV